jgi:asparagine synthase (glutamine-hydrolysing)
VSGYFGLLRLDGAPIEERLLESIADSISFRGPDGRSVWKQNNVGGCFTWMKTGPVPQSTQQPVIWRNRYFLWGDVRLDARQEVSQQLGDKNPAEVQGLTSEELLLRAWETWGPSCLERVIGEFSFGLWDAEEEVFWCARDFVGVRPFYYSHGNKIFCFSNTLPILRMVPEVSRELDETFVGDFLIEGWNADAFRTVYRDIRRLPAGHLLKLTKKSFEVRRFRTLPIEEPLRFRQPQEYVEAYRELLKVCVNDRLPGGPTALYLSGGLDSATICATAAGIAETRGQKDKLKAFTLSWNPFFEDEEPQFAQLTAQHLGIAHKVLQEEKLKPFEEAESEERIAPEPNQEFFFAREQRNSQMIADYSNVVLSGDGGDDVLTGQAWPYLTHLLKNRDWKDFFQDFGGYFWTHKRIPPLRAGFRTKLRKFVTKADQYEGYPDWLNPQFENKANLRQRWLEFRQPAKKAKHPLHPEAYQGLHDGFWASVLETEDAGWNDVRLETRGPLLDLRVLRFLLRLPPVPWCVKKELSRQAMQGLLPGTILERPKSPLLFDPIQDHSEKADWINDFPKSPSGQIEVFVNWGKWCETLYHSKGSLRWIILRPVILFHWLNAVENR